MTFDEWWKDYGKDCDSRDYRVAKDAFEAGQNNCNCVHTDNSEVIFKHGIECNIDDIQEDVFKLRIENNALKYVIEDIKQQIKNKKHCENCKYYTEGS